VISIVESGLLGSVNVHSNSSWLFVDNKFLNFGCDVAICFNLSQTILKSWFSRLKMIIAALESRHVVYERSWPIESATYFSPRHILHSATKADFSLKLI
jgi:hypothetical protein